MYSEVIKGGMNDMHRRVLPIPLQARLSNECIQLDSSWFMQGQSGNNHLQTIMSKWTRKFGLSPGQAAGQARQIQLLANDDLLEDEYSLDIGQELIRLSAGSTRGFDYGMQTLWQLSPDGRLPLGSIKDRPALKIRGFHINFASFRQMTIDDAINSIRWAADLKLNTVLIEYAERFPYKNLPGLAVNTSLTRPDITRLNAEAAELGIKIIPLQQTIGHLGYLVSHPDYAHIRENTPRPEANQICPLSSDALACVKEMLQDIIDSHPGIEYIHIGGDEARHLGKCSKCQEKVAQFGVGQLYADYINSISEFILAQGITPIIWDDMLCTHPTTLDLIDKRIIIMYWDYWVVKKASAHFIARYDRAQKPVTVCDEKWGEEWKNELSNLESAILDVFASQVDLSTNLSADFMAIYGQYLGSEFPKRIKAFPYLEFYQDKGFKVIGAPTTLGNGDNYHSLPNYWRFVPNIRTVAERCIEAGAEGMVTSSWYNYHPASFQFGIVAAAQFAWGGYWE